MNYQKQIPDYINKIFNNRKVQFMDIDYYAYPQTFGSTSGPCGGMGGNSISTFTVEAYVCDSVGPTIFVCCGMYMFDDSKFKPFKYAKGAWIKL